MQVNVNVSKLLNRMSMSCTEWQCNGNVVYCYENACKVAPVTRGDSDLVLYDFWAVGKDLALVVVAVVHNHRCVQSSSL